MQVCDVCSALTGSLTLSVTTADDTWFCSRVLWLFLPHAERSSYALAPCLSQRRTQQRSSQQTAAYLRTSLGSIQHFEGCLPSCLPG
jgi:hypothetical protein